MSTEPIPQARADLRELLQRVDLASQFQRAARCRELGLPQIELAALETLVTSGGLTPGELGQRLGLTSGGVTALTGRLVEAGLVSRGRHPGDGRMRVLSATDEGAERLADRIGPVLQAADEAVASLSGAEAELVGRFLELVESLKTSAAESTPGPHRERSSDRYTRALLM